MTSVRGGSKLLHYLLENHPNIVSFPRTFQFDDFWNNLETKNSREYIIEKFVTDFPRFFDGNIWKNYNILDKADELGVNRNESFKLNIDLFKENFLKISSINTINSKSVFLNLHQAYQETIGRVFNNESIILYHIHAIKNINSLDFCIKDFGINNIKVIFMTKHPLSGMRSIVKWMDNVSIPIETQPVTLLYYFEEILKGYDEIINLNELIDFKIFLLENLLENRKNFLKNLVDFLEIDWSDNILYPTILGKEWWGNSLSYKKGIDNNFTNFKPINLLEKKDWLLMKVFLSTRMMKYGFIKSEYNGIFYKKLFLFWLIFFPTYYEKLIFKKFLKKKDSFSKEMFLRKKIIFLRNFFYAFLMRIFKSLIYFSKN
tara:strand:+ start:132 stop:1250 length:1119 start_codon:yes stop_codon:yes gene_type:complete